MLLLGWLAVVRLVGYCKAGLPFLFFLLLAVCFDWLGIQPSCGLAAKSMFAGNPITRIPDFVQPWSSLMI